MLKLKKVQTKYRWNKISDAEKEFIEKGFLMPKREN
jgi:hypothetical protein